jgi:hypothetical protein
VPAEVLHPMPVTLTRLGRLAPCGPDPVVFGEPGQPWYEGGGYEPDWCAWCQVRWNSNGPCWLCGRPSSGNRIPLPTATRAGEDP